MELLDNSQHSPAHYELVSKGKYGRCRAVASAKTLKEAARIIRNVAARDHGALVVEVSRAGRRIGLLGLNEIRKRNGIRKAGAVLG